ncbi:MAG: hypothetical protein H0U63_05725 [Burkholderiales bacterium]|nr:hypothetical protein [Burkholderiales bacterium]
MAFISMGLAAGGVFASVAFNQFSPTPIEPSPSKMQSAALNIITMVPSLFANSGAPVQVVVEPAEPPLMLVQETHQARPAAPAARSSKAKSTRTGDSKADEVFERLKELQQELMDLKTRFTDLHPDVVQKRRHIERLREEERRGQERS